MQHRVGVSSIVILFSLLITVANSWALGAASVDSWQIARGGSSMFADPFSASSVTPPDFQDGTAATYFVDGAPTEGGGKLRLDTVGALVVPGIGASLSFAVEAILLNTGISSANPHELTSSVAFSQTGLFDLVTPGPIFERYGIRLTDKTSLGSPGKDLLDVDVQRFSNGQAGISFIRFDEALNTFTVFGIAFLEPNHDQIALSMSHQADSTAITGSFQYVDASILVGSPTVFSQSADIFRGQSFTRPQLLFATPIPEPASLVLCAVGVAGLSAIALRRHQRG